MTEPLAAALATAATLLVFAAPPLLAWKFRGPILGGVARAKRRWRRCGEWLVRRPERIAWCVLGVFVVFGAMWTWTEVYLALVE